MLGLRLNPGWRDDLFPIPRDKFGDVHRFFGDNSYIAGDYFINPVIFKGSLSFYAVFRNQDFINQLYKDPGTLNNQNSMESREGFVVFLFYIDTHVWKKLWKWMYICRYCTSHVNTCMCMQVPTTKDLYISSYICGSTLRTTFPTGWPTQKLGDLACCMYLGNAYTSNIPMLLAELKCILLTAKKTEINRKHQNGRSMDGIYVNSAVFIFCGGHPYSMGVILKNACDSVAQSVVGDWEGAVPFVKLSLSLDGGCRRTVATICLSQLRKTKNKWNLPTRIEALQTFFISSPLISTISSVSKLKWNSFHFPMNQSLHPWSASQLHQLPMLALSTSPVADLTTQV